MFKKSVENLEKKCWKFGKKSSRLKKKYKNFQKKKVENFEKKVEN